MMIGVAAFGAFQIARPLSKIAFVLRELTSDRMVDVPCTERNDEVGDIAKATELFKQSIAEKLINLSVRRGPDVVTSNVMLADSQFNILYMNDVLVKM